MTGPGAFRLDPAALDGTGTGRGSILAPGGEAERHDRLVPLINIVFLLLCFFMIAGTIRAVDAIEVTPPQATSRGEVRGDAPMLLVGRDGALAFAGKREGQAAVLRRIGAWRAHHGDAALRIKADGQVPAGLLLPLLVELRDAGIARVTLVVTRREAGR